jgi:hypothetical protein
LAERAVVEEALIFNGTAAFETGGARRDKLQTVEKKNLEVTLAPDGKVLEDSGVKK